MSLPRIHSFPWIFFPAKNGDQYCVQRKFPCVESDSDLEPGTYSLQKFFLYEIEAVGTHPCSNFHFAFTFWFSCFLLVKTFNFFIVPIFGLKCCVVLGNLSFNSVLCLLFPEFPFHPKLMNL